MTPVARMNRAMPRMTFHRSRTLSVTSTPGLTWRMTSSMLICEPPYESRPPPSAAMRPITSRMMPARTAPPERP